MIILMLFGTTPVTAEAVTATIITIIITITIVIQVQDLQDPVTDNI